MDSLVAGGSYPEIVCLMECAAHGLQGTGSAITILQKNMARDTDSPMPQAMKYSRTADGDYGDASLPTFDDVRWRVGLRNAEIQLEELELDNLDDLA